MPSVTYKDLVFTKHALERMSYRSVSPEAVWSVLQYPNETRPEGKPNTTRFIRNLNDRNYHVIGTYLPDQKKTLIISVWVRGEEDKMPLLGQIILLPFKIVWSILKFLYRKMVNYKR